MLILCDENIAHIDDYLAPHHIKVIKLKGRDINQAAIDTYNPNALLIRSVTPISPSTITDFKNVSFIGSATIGTDHVDMDFLKNHFVTFANAAGCSKHSVAQYVITAILTNNPSFFNKKIQLGIIGLGNIGTALSQYAQELNWQILGYDPYLPKSSINNSDFDQLLTNSDVISIHTPLTKHDDYPTYQLFNQTAFAKLKDNALIINSARGEIICQNALLDAIFHKNIKAILDVFPHEPMIDKTLLNQLTLATPHIAGYTLEGKIRGTDMIYRALCQNFHLPILQTFNHLLPKNPYHWRTLKNNISLLPTYYDIKKDDKSLRLMCDNHGVQDKDFDALRKNYLLKREWLFDE